jgi:hypothetical protein
MEVSRRLSPSQYYLYRKIHSTSRQRANIAIAQVGLTPEGEHQLERAKRSLRRSRIVINLNFHERIFGKRMIDSLLESRRIYNLYEIAQTAVGYNPSELRMRVMLEFKLYGGTRDLLTPMVGMTNTEHPNYGTLDYRNDPIGLSALGFYGWYRFVLKSPVRERSTFCSGDSFGITPDEVFVWDDIEGVLASRIGDGRPYWFECVNERVIPIDDFGNTSYIEAQILGGVFLEDDVEALYYPETDQFNRSFFRKLRRFEDEFNITLKPY